VKSGCERFRQHSSTASSSAAGGTSETCVLKTSD
jgi:hypothetical protein